jgi:hypothetical protein
MSHLSTTSLPADPRFASRAPESFVDDAALAPMIAGAILPWQDRSYDGEDFAGRDDISTPSLPHSFPSASIEASTDSSPLIIAAPKSPRWVALRKISYWLSVSLLLAYIALCLIAAFQPAMLDTLRPWLPLDLLPFSL